MRIVRWVALCCVLLLLIYGASPYFSFWQFTNAVRSGDSAAINARVYFPAVRAALKNLQNPRQFRFSSGKTEDWSKVKYAFFTGPRSFAVDREGIKLRFRFTGLGWQLNDLDLGLAGQSAKPY